MYRVGFRNKISYFRLLNFLKWRFYLFVCFDKRFYTNLFTEEKTRKYESTVSAFAQNSFSNKKYQHSTTNNKLRNTLRIFMSPMLEWNMGITHGDWCFTIFL